MPDRNASRRRRTHLMTGKAHAAPGEQPSGPGLNAADERSRLRCTQLLRQRRLRIPCHKTCARCPEVYHSTSRNLWRAGCGACAPEAAAHRTRSRLLCPFPANFPEWYPRFTPKQWQYFKVLQQDYDSGIVRYMRNRKQGIIHVNLSLLEPSLRVKRRHCNAVDLDSYCQYEIIILPFLRCPPIDFGMGKPQQDSRRRLRRQRAGSTDTTSPRGLVAIPVGTNCTPP